MPTIQSPVESLVIGETAGTYSLVLSPRATLTFDRTGRPTGLYENGMYLARGYDGRCVEKKWVWIGAGAAHRHLRSIPDEEQRELRRRWNELLGSCRDYLSSSAPEVRLFQKGLPAPTTPAQARRFIDFLQKGLERSWTAEVARFHQIWNPIGMLPPDRYLSMVVQVSEGCAWNRCTFCDLYARRPSRVRSLEEIRAHVDQVENFFGESLPGRCSIFLGDANALEAPADLLTTVAKELSARFPHMADVQEDGIGGIYSFAETTRLAQWTEGDLRGLREAGFRRAYIGMETGHDPLRRWLAKPGTGDSVSEGARKLKSAGIGVGLIVLLGAGGRENAEDHTRETARHLQKAGLSAGDIVYFSPLHAEANSAYGRSAASRGWTPLSGDEMQEQRHAIESAFDQRGERRALYDIREFIY